MFLLDVKIIIVQTIILNQRLVRRFWFFRTRFWTVWTGFQFEFLFRRTLVTFVKTFRFFGRLKFLLLAHSKNGLFLQNHIDFGRIWILAFGHRLLILRFLNIRCSVLKHIYCSHRRTDIKWATRWRILIFSILFDPECDVWDVFKTFVPDYTLRVSY